MDVPFGEPGSSENRFVPIRESGSRECIPLLLTEANTFEDEVLNPDAYEDFLLVGRTAFVNPNGGGNFNDMVRSNPWGR